MIWCRLVYARGVLLLVRAFNWAGLTYDACNLLEHSRYVADDASAALDAKCERWGIDRSA